MKLWFLRLFWQFRLLERQLEQFKASYNIMKDMCDTAIATAEKLKVQARELEALVSQEQSGTSAMASEQDALRNAYDELLTEKLLLQDRLDATLSERSLLWEAMREATGHERDAYQMQINHLTQKNGGGVPYPDAHSLPPNAIRKIQEPGPVGRSQRMLPSEAAVRQNTAFLKSYFTPEENK